METSEQFNQTKQNTNTKTIPTAKFHHTSSIILQKRMLGKLSLKASHSFHKHKIFTNIIHHSGRESETLFNSIDQNKNEFISSSEIQDFLESVYRQGVNLNAFKIL